MENPMNHLQAASLARYLSDVRGPDTPALSG
jgi:hypothetical protein